MLQKEAFETLQCRKDARHKRVTSQIHLIEQELTELTLLEMEQSDIRLSIQMVGVWFLSRFVLFFCYGRVSRSLLKRANFSIIFFMWVLVTGHRKTFWKSCSTVMFLKYMLPLFLFYIFMTEYSGRKAEGTDSTAYSAFGWKEEKRRWIEG